MKSRNCEFCNALFTPLRAMGDSIKRQKFCSPMCRRQAEYARNKEHYRENFYIRAYGITLVEYDQLSDQQGNVCAICKRSEQRENFSSRLSVDHDHETGAVRGLLCSACNHSLGGFEDNIESLQAAIDYLKGDL